MRLFFAQEDVEDGELAHWFVDEGEADGANEDNDTEVGDSGRGEGNGHKDDGLPISQRKLHLWCQSASVGG